MTDLILEPLARPISLPLLAGLICLLLPERWEVPRAWLAVAAAAGTLLTVWPLFAGAAETSSAGLLGMDPLSGFILLAASVSATLIALYSLQYMRGRRGQGLYYACLLWSLACAAGVLLARDLLVLVTFWGLLAITLYLMIGLAGPVASAAAKKTLVIVGGSDACLMLGTALLWIQHGSTRMDATAVSLVSAADYLACMCFAAAAFAKAGAIPLHTWLPDYGETADAPVTALLPASLDKLLGIYLLARIVLDLFEMTPAMNTLLMFLGAITIIGAVLMALVQHNLKRLLAFHAVSQVGYMLLGIGTGSVLGLAAALFHMLNNAIYKSCLFLVAGVVEQQTGTADLDRLGGLATRLPLTFAAALIAALSISGIPPLNGFASKWMIYQAVIDTGSGSGNMLWVVWLTAAVAGSALTLASFVKVLHSVFLCKPSPQVRQATIHRGKWPTILPLLLLAGLCVVFGIFAKEIPLRYLIEPAIGAPLEFTGTWLASQASGLLLLAMALGWIVYAFTLRNGKLRKMPTYIGGEIMDETRITGIPVGPQRHVEVTGVDFYETVEQLPLLTAFYRVAQSKIFDIYETGRRVAFWFIGLLRGAHTGLLTSYLVWFVVGLLGILLVMVKGNL